MKQPDLKTALKIYYSCSEIGVKEIKELFGVSDSTARTYKDDVRKEMNKRNVKVYRPRQINTKVAYDVWGIDIDWVERSLKKLKSLNLDE